MPAGVTCPRESFAEESYFRSLRSRYFELSPPISNTVRTSGKRVPTAQAIALNSFSLRAAKASPIKRQPEPVTRMLVIELRGTNSLNSVRRRSTLWTGFPNVRQYSETTIGTDRQA